MNNVSIKEWQKQFGNGEFMENNVRVQIKAGWYDWFCKDTSLANKTQRLGRIVSQVKEGGKVDLTNWYVWFKNNCPLNGPLYDDFRFADLKTYKVMFTIQVDCCWNKHRYAVYGRKPVNGEWEEHFDTPLFECDSSRELVKWLNTPWEE